MAVSVAFAEGQPFSRYQTIIDRKPFGPEPVNFDPEALPGSAAASGAAGEMTPEQRTAEERQLAAKVRVSILNVTPTGAVKVGFTDSSVTPNENYYLKVGASQNGWTVKDADPKTESVTLEKDGVEVTLKLGEASGGRDAKGGQSKRRQAAAMPAAMPLSASNRDAEPEASGRGRSIGGLARLRQRRMEKKAEEQAEEERKREAAAVAEEARKEREAAEAAEKQRVEEERRQQREALMQIQEQLRKAREEREAAAANKANEEEQGETDNAE